MQNEPSGNAAQSGTLKRELYFPTLIYHVDLPGSDELNSSVKARIYTLRTEDRDGIVRSNMQQVGSWHSRLDLHQQEDFGPIANAILQNVQRVFGDLGYDQRYEAVFDNFWANINPKYGYNRNHIHPNVLWSGVYYVQAPADSGRIFFSDPRAQALVLTPRYTPDVPRKPEVWPEVYFEPVEGRLILFPAWLTHEVEPNMSNSNGAEGDRISISFNVRQVLRSPAE